MKRCNNWIANVPVEIMKIKKLCVEVHIGGTKLYLPLTCLAKHAFTEEDIQKEMK